MPCIYLHARWELWYLAGLVVLGSRTVVFVWRLLIVINPLVCVLILHEYSGPPSVLDDSYNDELRPYSPPPPPPKRDINFKMISKRSEKPINSRSTPSLSSSPPPQPPTLPLIAFSYIILSDTSLIMKDPMTLKRFKRTLFITILEQNTTYEFSG